MNRMKRILITIITVIFTISVIPINATEDDTMRNVKVGFFESTGYHIIDKNGVKSGYGYDFLQKMLQYNDWSYEYIGYDANWSDMLTMLDNGEIDMVTLADKTAEREKKYDFSAKPIGVSSTIMSVNSDNTTIIPGDYTTYNNAVIGLVKDSSHNVGFESYAKEKGFSYQPKYYESIDDLLSDLRNNNGIDIAVTSNMRVLENEMVLDEFNSKNYYVMVKKGNNELLNQLNYGIEQLDINSNDWQNTLFNKYYDNVYSKVISLSVDERQYINYLKDNNIVIKAAMNPELAPYTYFKDGKALGIAPTLFKEVAKRLGIKYEILYSKDRWQYKEQLKNREADLDLTAYFDYGLAQQNDLKETDSYIKSTMAMLTKKGTSTKNDNITIAMVKDPTEYVGYNEKLLKKYKYKEYNSIQACIDAVKDGEVDATFQYAYIAEKATNEDFTNSLQYSVIPTYDFELCIGVFNAENHCLLSILNKGINSLTENYKQGVMLEKSSNMTYSNSFMGVIYDYPLIVIGAVITLVLLLFVAIMLYLKNRNQKDRSRTASEMERFIKYICESYETVAEQDLVANKRIIYTIEDDKLVTEVRDHKPFDREYFKDLVKVEDLDMIVEAFSDKTVDELIANGGERYLEVQIRDRDDKDHDHLLDTYSWYSYIIRGVPKDKWHPRNFVVFEKQIQEAKQNEEKQKQVLRDALETAKSASEAKGQFLSRMSHEIRTPLNAVIGYMDIARDSKGDPNKIMHCINNSDIAAKHLLSIINDVLDISSIESGRMKIAHQEFNLDTLLTSLTTIFYNQTRDKKVKFDVALDNLSQEYVIGDSLRLNQILMNLLSNAVKFTPEGGTIKLSVNQVISDNHNVFMKFEVSDTGIGMSKEYQSRLFQPFEQENAITAQKYGGTGLGLSITFNLINLMGGSIEVNSIQGKGSTFVVSLHFDVDPDKQHHPIQHDYSSVRVLIIDDSKEASSYIKSLFKRCKVKSDIISDGDKALKRIQGRITTDYKYNLCLINLDMESDDPYNIARRINEECLEDAPTIVAIAYDAADKVDQAKEVGIVKVISKPVFQSTMFDLLVSTYGKYSPKIAANKNYGAIKGLHVLLVEDNEMNMEIAVEILKKAGLEVDQSVNGKEAYDRFISSPKGTYDAILMDIQMPIMDGYQATIAIRESDHEQSKDIPIIAMTANAFVEDVNAALASGMNGHISKPVNYEKLYEELYKYCKRDQ